MNSAIVYLLNRFMYRFMDFFHHWYIDGTRRIAHSYMSTLEDLDRRFAVKITLRHFFEPLYRDYSVIGRILGVVFRSLRIIIGSLFYLVISIIFGIVFLTWLAVVPIILFYILHGI